MSKPVQIKSPEGKSRCPICDKPTAEDFRPFCSKRCADVDLHRWLNSSYVIQTEEEADDSMASGSSEQ
ncbi:DNA gyrase inhibitor YacG [Microvirga sp. W0021]|uniref:DNA gyrase inhibitor YacG n=1 Tax=Hohaiivirga grylli TaxID=3133970 RepID=A0ABV0BHP5_9HYPH